MHETVRAAVLALVIVSVASFARTVARGETTLPPAIYRTPPAAYPFVVKVMTQSDSGLGTMTVPDMAKLVSIMEASGAPAGAYTAALAAGMKTAWYQDPHRIGDVPGAMSDRPPVTALRKSADLMKCVDGNLLDSTYGSTTGTYFGDPTSSTLIRESNAQLSQAVSHYGPVTYLWLDDSLPLSELWAQAWHCGSKPPALTTNGANGMPSIAHGTLGSTPISYANGTAYSPQTFLANLAKFDTAMRAPVIDEGACIGDGTTLGGNVSDGGPTASLAKLSKNSAGIMCENFAEGWGNRQTRDGKAVDEFWLQDLNSGIQVISAGKMFVNLQYIGDEGATNRGISDDYDQRGYIYASFMLLFDPQRSIYKTGLWGSHRDVKAPVIVHPENLLVPLQPLTTAVWPNRVTALQSGGVYLREFAACGYAGKPIGPCAALVNPSSAHEAAIPSLRQRYGHAIAFTGNDGAFTGRHGTPDYGDTGDIDFASKRPPTSLPPAGWAILVP